MLRFEDAPKKPTSFSRNAQMLAMPLELGMNVSKTVDAMLVEEVKRRCWARWNAQNQDAMASCNARAVQEGLLWDALGAFDPWPNSMCIPTLTPAFASAHPVCWMCNLAETSSHVRNPSR
jgi:antitoxin CcdA